MKKIALCLLFCSVLTSSAAYAIEPPIHLNFHEPALVSDEITEVKASHILVNSKAEAEKIRKEIEGGLSFEDAAKKYSKCPSKQNGGDLGYFSKGDMVPEFEKVAFTQKVDEISQPVKTQFGWHLIKVTDRR